MRIMTFGIDLANNATERAHNHLIDYLEDNVSKFLEDMEDSIRASLPDELADLITVLEVRG